MHILDALIQGKNQEITSIGYKWNYSQSGFGWGIWISQPGSAIDIQIYPSMSDLE